MFASVPIARPVGGLHLLCIAEHCEAAMASMTMMEGEREKERERLRDVFGGKVTLMFPIPTFHLCHQRSRWKKLN